MFCILNFWQTKLQISFFLLISCMLIIPSLLPDNNFVSLSNKIIVHVRKELVMNICNNSLVLVSATWILIFLDNKNKIV